MKKHVKIQTIQNVTHDVLQIVAEKPEEFSFVPGQATEVSINKEGWEKEGRPFTFTSLPTDPYLEFTIKTYPSHQGVTNQLLQLKKGDELILTDIFGAIEYKGEGVFIAGGAGVTPFISILRSLESKNKIADNKLIFANKTEADIIHKNEFENLLGENFVNILSEEKNTRYAEGLVTKDFLKMHITDNNNYFYICGPMPMIEAVKRQLKELGTAEAAIITEDF